MFMIFNPKFPRWEVFDAARSVTRNREIQPVFVSAEKSACDRYIERVEGDQR